MQECLNCYFSRDIQNNQAIACHRYPPSITKVDGPTVTSHFPLLANTEWCGEWKKKRMNARSE